MELNLFKNKEKDTKSNINIKNFMEELSKFLNKTNSSNVQDNTISLDKNSKIILEEIDTDLQKNRKEGQLYLVTEDRNNEIYLWDFTDKPKHEFKEIVSSEELLSIAKEGAMLQYKNGKYELYSSYGFDMLYNEKNQK